MGDIMNGEHNPRHQSINIQNGYREISSRIEHCALEDGIALIEEFLRETPDHAQAHNDLAVLYYRKGNKLQTLGHYEKAVRLSPDNSLFRKNLASFYFVEMGWTDDAIHIYTDILKRSPDDSETLCSLGIISNALGRMEEAKIFFRKLLDLEPWNIEAKQAYESAVTSNINQTGGCSFDSLNPSEPQQISHINPVISGLRETITKLEKSVQDNEYMRAQQRTREGEIDEAILDLESLLKKEPHNAQAHNDLGVLYYRSGNIAKSVDHYEFAVANSPRNPLFLKNLADIYYTEAGRTDDAVQIYVSLLKEHPEDSETLSALAIISMNNDRPEEAQVFLRKILEMEPHNHDARSLLESLKSKDERGFFLHKR